MKARSIEEALAGMAEKGEALKGWRRLAAVVQGLLRKAGLTRLANMLEAKTDAEAWKARFMEQMIDTEITQVGASAGVGSFELFSAFVRPRAAVVEVMDEAGKGTGKFKVEASWIEKNEKKEDVELKLPVTDMVAKMREDQVRFGSLFNSKARPGTGSTAGGGGTGGMPKGMTHAEYLLVIS